ncbi:MAG: TolC family protein [Syntrophorhabdaceae bacterium]|nr:TolC family protein [Syntrophorhabdaceae bacterium]
MPGDAGSRLIITAGRLASEIMLFLTMIVILSAGSPPLLAAGSSTLDLDELIREALSRNPELLVSESKVSASGYRIPQAKSLPDPMFMFGYQNEGFRQITIGEEANAMGMLSLSQMFPFFGKLDLKGQMAAKDAESLKSMHKATQLKTVATVKQLYYELFVAYKNIEVLKKLADYFSRIEDAATARYASGMGSRQEIVMAQTERYMLLEKEEMQRQKIEVLQGMLNNTLGREANSPLGRPVELPYTPYIYSIEEALQMAKSNSPEIESRKRMAEAAEARVKMAKKEYYPDTTLGVGYFPKTKGMLDMWNVTVTVNIPIFYKTKQEQAVLEAESGLLGARRELAAAEYMLSSGIRENHSMVRSSEKLMKLYRDGLIPKTYQDFQLALSGYASGKTEAITAISRLKALLDTELLYWSQYAQRERAIAMLDAITGRTTLETGARDEKANDKETVGHTPGGTSR